MIIPTKHEKLSTSMLVVGATVLKKLKRKPYVLEDLFETVRLKHEISINAFLDTILFLGLCELVETNGYEVKIRGVN